MCFVVILCHLGAAAAASHSTLLAEPAGCDRERKTASFTSHNQHIPLVALIPATTQAPHPKPYQLKPVLLPPHPHQHSIHPSTPTPFCSITVCVPPLIPAPSPLVAASSLLDISSLSSDPPPPLCPLPSLLARCCFDLLDAIGRSPASKHKIP